MATDQETSEETSNLGLLDILLVIVAHKKMIFCVTFGAALLTAIYSLTLPNIYTAKTMILPGDDDRGGLGAMLSQLGGLKDLAGGNLDQPQKKDLYVTILKSETIKDPIIDRFKLMTVFGKELRSDAYRLLDAKALITPGKKDGVVTIEFSDRDPQRAAAIANAYVEELGKLMSSLVMTGAGNSRAFLEKRLAEARAELMRTEESLKNFQSRNKAIDVTAQAKATIEEVARMQAQLAILEVQLAGLQRQYTDSSQEVKTARVAISNIRNQIARVEGGGTVSSIPMVGTMPQLSQEYIRLLREFKIQEALVDLLTKQYEMARINEVKDISSVQILQKARVPDRKSKPHRAVLVIQITLITFCLTCLATYVIEEFKQMDDCEKSRWRIFLESFPVLRRLKM